MAKVKSIKINKDDKYVAFTIKYIDEFDGEIYEIDYHTNNAGEGLWIGDDYTDQIIGTCDFALRQKTRSGMYKAIKRWAER